MDRHRAIVAPKFAAVVAAFERDLAGTGVAAWTVPKGGYFISLDVLDGCAEEVVRLAKAAGVELTPAGSTHPRGHDPRDRNIRIAPTFPDLATVATAAEGVAISVLLATSAAAQQLSATTRAHHRAGHPPHRTEVSRGHPGARALSWTRGSRSHGGRVADLGLVTGSGRSQWATPLQLFALGIAAVFLAGALACSALMPRARGLRSSCAADHPSCRRSVAQAAARGAGGVDRDAGAGVGFVVGIRSRVAD